MSRVWLINANQGLLCAEFRNDGHASIGYSLRDDLTNFSERFEIEKAYREAKPKQSNPATISWHVNQIKAFLSCIKAGDHILTPTRDRRKLMHGIVENRPPYFVPDAVAVEGSPHRIRVAWAATSITFDDPTLKKHGIYGHRGTVKLISEDNDEFWKSHPGG